MIVIMIVLGWLVCSVIGYVLLRHDSAQIGLPWTYLDRYVAMALGITGPAVVLAGLCMVGMNWLSGWHLPDRFHRRAKW